MPMFLLILKNSHSAIVESFAVGVRRLCCRMSARAACSSIFNTALWFLPAQIFNHQSFSWTGVWHTWENLLQNALNPWDWWDWLTIKPRAIWSLDSINLPSGHCIREGKKNVPAQHLQQHGRHSSCSLILWWCSTAPSSSITQNSICHRPKPCSTRSCRPRSRSVCSFRQYNPNTK